MDNRKPRSIPRTFDEYVEQQPDDVIRALKAWISLSEGERGQFTQLLNQVNDLPKSDRERLPTIITNVPLGPWESRVPTAVENSQFSGRE